MTTESNIHTAIHEKTLEKLLERIEQSTLADPDYQCKNAFKKRALNNSFPIILIYSNKS